MYEKVKCYVGDPFVEGCKWVIFEEKEKKMIEKEDHGKFWMVWREWGPPPTRKHTTFNEALEEAIRLSEKESSVFYILEAVEIVEQLPGPIVHRPLKVEKIGDSS